MSLAYTDINPCLVHAMFWQQLVEQDIDPIALGEIVPLMAMMDDFKVVVTPIEEWYK